MRKMKIFTPIMATIAVASPALATITGCSKTNYTEKVNELKDATISTFIDLSKTTHRGVWDQTEIYDYVRKSMQSMGFTKPAGSDNWCQVPEVQETIAKKTGKTPGTKDFPSYGNIWYDIPASAGFENVPAIILHGHLDADFAFKDDEAEQEWKEATTNIVNVIYDRDNDILKTGGKTSLGADNGIGVAFMLSVAKLRNEFKHGPIRLLFAAGESEATTHYAAGSHFLVNDQCYKGKETWVGHPTEDSYLETGSSLPFGEKDGDFKYIISTSGIYKNAIYCSTAGIHECEYNDSKLSLNNTTSDDLRARNDVQWHGFQPGTEETVMKCYKLSISGLHGGQSAKNINSGYASALFMLMRIIFSGDRDMQLISASSQPGAYAISSSAEAVFTSLWTLEAMQEKVDAYTSAFKNAYPGEEWSNVKIKLEHIQPTVAKETYKYGLSAYQTRGFTRLCASGLIYGPIDWFDKEHTNVRTSCNYGKLNLAVDQNGAEGGSKFEFHAVCRSASEESLLIFYSLTHSLMEDAMESMYPKAEEPLEELEKHIIHVDNPVWERDPENKMTALAFSGYQNMGVTPYYWDNHGWVEVGCYPEAYSSAHFSKPQITVLGPEIRNSKACDEEVWTDTLNPMMGAFLYIFEHIS